MESQEIAVHERSNERETSTRIVNVGSCNDALAHHSNMSVNTLDVEGKKDSTDYDSGSTFFLDGCSEVT